MKELINQPMSFVFTLLILLLAARVLGEIMERLKQPAMIGEVLAGVILGPSLLGMVHPSHELSVISDLAVLLLVIVAGIDIQPQEIRNSIRGKNIWIAILSFMIPFLSGFLIGYFFKLDILITIFLGLCISITALPVSIRILMDLGKLNTDIGQKIISAAIFNDIIALLVLGIILDVRRHWGSMAEITNSIGVTFLKMAIFLIIIYAVYKLFKLALKHVEFVNKWLNGKLNILKGKESLFALIIVFVLAFAAFTESAGLHFVIGAFFAALLLSKEILGVRNFVRVRHNTNGITMGFLAPVFFATIGVQFNLLSIENIWLLLIVLLASLASKVIGGYIGGRFAGLDKYESLTLGVGLNARGIMELVIANIALSNGFINQSLFSILVFMGLITTLVSPLLLKKSFLLIDKNKKVCLG